MKLKNNLFTVKEDNLHKKYKIFGISFNTLRKKYIKKVYIPKLENENIKLTQENEHLKYQIKELKNLKNTFKTQSKDLQHYIVEHSLYDCVQKLIPHTPDSMRIEVNLADHCNLNCKFCDHFSPIANEFYLDIETFENDIKRLSKLTNGNLGGLSLVGGEPLLNKNICEFLKIARKHFKNTAIDIVTNGILLDNNEKLWQAIKENDITLYITTYPININFEKFDKKAKELNIKYERFYMFGTKATEKVSVHHPFNQEGNVNKNDFIQCYHFNRCITLRLGKIYTCPIIPYSEHFNKYFNQNLKIEKTDYIDIYNAKSFDEIAQFCATRPSFCKYCNVTKRKSYPYGISKKDISEWT